MATVGRIGLFVAVPQVKEGHSFPSIHPCDLTPTGLLKSRRGSRKDGVVCDLCQKRNTFLSCGPCNFDICDQCFWLVGREWSPSPSSQKTKQEETFEQIMKEEVNCPICFETVQEAVESRCCHNLLCKGCSRGVSCCPFCRSTHFTPQPNLPVRKIVEKMNTFFSSSSSSTSNLSSINAKKRKEEEQKEKEKKAAKERREAVRRQEEERRRREEEERRRREEEERRRREEEERRRREVEERKRREEEERRRKAEEEMRKREEKKKQEEKERKRIQKIANESVRKIEERGIIGQSWIVPRRRSDFQSHSSSPTLEKIIFLPKGHFLVLDDGDIYWSGGIGKGRFSSLAKGRGGGLTKKVDILAFLSDSCYFIKFKDGKAYWAGLPSNVSEILQQANLIRDVVLGKSSSGSLQYIISTDQAIYSQVEGVHQSWFQVLKSCSLGPEGQFFIRSNGGDTIFSRLPEDQLLEVRSLSGCHKLRDLYFGYSNGLVIRHSPF